jgi:hypothetical protein
MEKMTARRSDEGLHIAFISLILTGKRGNYKGRGE